MTETAVSAWSPEAQQANRQVELARLYDLETDEQHQEAVKVFEEEFSLDKHMLAGLINPNDRYVVVMDRGESGYVYQIPKTLRDEEGRALRDSTGKVRTALDGGWQLIATSIRKADQDPRTPDARPKYTEMGVFYKKDESGNDLFKTIPRDDAKIGESSDVIDEDNPAGAARRLMRHGLAEPEVQTIEERRAEIAEQIEHEETVEEKVGKEALEEAAGIEDPERRELLERYPVLLKPDVEMPTASYDHLFATDDNVFEAVIAQQARVEAAFKESPEGKAKEYYEKYVTPENQKDSLRMLENFFKACPEAREILTNRGIDPLSPEAVVSIRENEDVRYEFAKLLTDRVNRLADEKNSDLGARIVENSPHITKANQVYGTRKYLSRQYAVHLALCMIDGTFSWSDSNSSDDQGGYNRVDGTGRVTTMQHRHAAWAALNDFSITSGRE